MSKPVKLTVHGLEGRLIFRGAFGDVSFEVQVDTEGGTLSEQQELARHIAQAVERALSPVVGLPELKEAP